ncbi:hypothetical protein DR999_PMT19135 [Platysternon megacephalum]|uniref:Uncharacterized protein n=1 Tax=Platysternon megacephalum TaxID=55544 RepID=A0A4D9DRH4_9SAUR|nr:hypothetical protein DR999_PMT19135 [Platysternon megacephalum]
MAKGWSHLWCHSVEGRRSQVWPGFGKSSPPMKHLSKGQISPHAPHPAAPAKAPQGRFSGCTQHAELSVRSGPSVWFGPSPSFRTTAFLAFVPKGPAQVGGSTEVCTWEASKLW